MRAGKVWKWMMKARHTMLDGVTCGFKMKNQLPFMGIVCMVMLFIVYRITDYQYREAEIDEMSNPFFISKVRDSTLHNLPRGIVQPKSDLELVPLWSSSSRSKVNDSGPHNLLAMAVGIKQKKNVDIIVRKFLSAKFSIMLFHYDGNVDEWWDLPWSKKAIHVVAFNQTKWWFAKRFLHPDVVSIYEYIFLWDEDLGVRHFCPGRYLGIVKSEGLEISQPALDPNSTEIHHRITARLHKNRFHSRVWEQRGSTNCSDDSKEPPCTGFVEGMAPVFSKAAWHCAWHLIQNDLVHGWGMDIKLGYCAQGDRTQKVGVVDTEFVLHQAIQTLGGESAKKEPAKKDKKASDDSNVEVMPKEHSVDVRAEIRRQSSMELEIFQKRWDEAVKADKTWVDPFPTKRRKTRRRKRKLST